VKWFKHFTDSLSDPFIEELMDNYSHAGYVAWFGLIEIICKENKYNVTGDLEISPIYLKRKLRISTTKLEQIFDFCQTKGKLLFNISQEKWVFKFSKVAELKDNYTKNLQATGKKVSLEVEEDKKKKEKKEPLAGFEDLWERYPNKDGKKAAEKYFHSTVKTEEDYTAINKALDKYITNLKTETWKKPKNGSTWFNNWQDWIDWEETGTMEPLYTMPDINGGTKDLYSEEEMLEHERKGPDGRH
jgi:hypothetical protein